MSDNRRRRKSQQSGGSDDLSDSYDEHNATKETQSSEHTEDHHDSEYDTAGSESDADSQDRTQRESGDGQEEEKPQKKLDDDEDRRNPQYIPKRGTFYEHDDRTADEVNDETTEAQPEREAKEKKVWKDKEDRWDHDRYNDEEQAPKSHAELIAVYGYDIRNEEGPPRARRRRRYGRGPNKYTRNWEDEDAYGKVAGNVPTHKSNTRKTNRTGEEFPLLNPKDNDTPTKTDDQPVITSAWYSNKNKIHPNKTQNFPPLHQTDSQKTKPKPFTNSQANENKAPNERNNTAWKREPKNTPYIQNANETTAATADTEKIVIVKTTPRENKRPPQVQESVSLAANRSRGRGFKANTNNNIVGSRTIESKPKGRGPGPINIDNRRSNVEHEQIINDMKHMNVSTEGPSYHHAARQNKHFYTQPSSQQHSTVVPPRMQPNHPQQQPPPPQQPPQQPPQPPPQQDITTNRPKRYSSLRQRPPIAEGPPNPAQPNYQPQHTYYPPPQAGSSRAVLESPGYPPGPYEQTPPVPAAAAGPMPGQPVTIPIPPGAQPTTYAPHAPPPFLVPTPQFIPPPQPAPPSIINYVAGPNGPIFQPNYQGFNPAAVQGPPPPQEVGLYQPQGCTYYSPAQQQQQQQQQPVPLRRPKAAIPILPPPDNLQNPNSRGRSRSIQQQAQEQQQQQQIQQQQQQQEQLVQQQLQQHQQQLIQQQQQERQQLEQEQSIQQQQQQEQLIQQKQLQQRQQEQLIQQKQQQQEQLVQQKQQQQEQLVQQKQQQQEQLVQQTQQQQGQLVQQKQQQQEQLDQQKLQHQEQLVPQKEQQQEQLVQKKVQQQEQLVQQQQLENDSSNKVAIQPVPETPAETASNKDEPVASDNVNISTNTKIEIEEKLEKIVAIDVEPVIASEDKVSQPIVVEAAEEKKEVLTKVEVVVPEVVPDVTEEKATKTTLAITEVPVVTAVVEQVKTEIPVPNCAVESSAVIASEETMEVSTKTAELVSGKSDTDCSIKESAVIEEAAA